MSCLRKFEYIINPVESFEVIRNCSICKSKSTFVNSNKFRVNANGKLIDVWLIYQCKKCKHTYNLTIYERLSKDAFSSMQFQCFMENDKDLANKYGTNKSIFITNKAEINWSNIDYQIIDKNSKKLLSDEQISYKVGDYIQIYNPLGLNIRTDKIIADVLNVTRSKLKQIHEKGKIEIVKSDLANNVNIIINSDTYNINT